jgi:hypothetical protein
MVRWGRAVCRSVAREGEARVAKARESGVQEPDKAELEVKVSAMVDSSMVSSHSSLLAAGSGAEAGGTDTWRWKAGSSLAIFP